MIEEKVIKLKEAKKVLKTEFIGLDDIIDRVFECIAPWYLTPEVIERPIVISLWGLTGTGKTSLVRRLLNLLEITGKSMFFDCGEQAGTMSDSLFSDKLDSLFDSSSVNENDFRFTKDEISKFDLDLTEAKKTEKTDPLDYTFVFDEFQYLRTKDEENKEVDRSGSRAIWNLIDSGLIDINQNSYKINRLLDYFVDLEAFLGQSPDTKLKGGRFDPNISSKLSSTVMYFRWYEPDGGDDEKEEEKQGYRVIDNDDLATIVRRLNMIKRGLGFGFSEKIDTFTNLKDYLAFLKDYIDLISKPKIINCSKSLVFVLGNLDEAFSLTGDDMDPDVDADVYHDMTSKVNIMDIKNALKRRFRDEQIGRLGNNIIIYPSLRKQDFERVIDKELGRIASKFYKLSGIAVEYSSKMKKFIYSEGVYPIQGVRPIFTTISSIITPRISEILVSKEQETNRIVLDVASERTDSETVTLMVYQFNDATEIRRDEKIIKTTLGSLRDPKRCEKLAIQSVHEASHSVVYSKLTGKFPSAIIAGCITGGGFMMKEIKEDLSSEGVYEFENDVMTSLAGYVGERIFFDEKRCTLGASSDFSAVWDNVADAFAHCGYYKAFTYSYGTSTEQTGFTPAGISWREVEQPIKDFLENMCNKTKELIIEEKELIREISKYLSENRCMSIDLYKEYISKYAKTFNLKEMNSVREYDKSYYITKLYESD